MEQNDNKPEARGWLKNNKHPIALAGNRFKDTQTALDFVEKLYQMGAVRVLVGDIDPQGAGVGGGPYADSLTVELPNNQQKRVKLFETFAEEARREGFEPTEDTGQGEVLLWWD